MRVRIKPYNPRIGNVVSRYEYRGIVYEAARGWYDIPDEDAAYLKTVHQHHGEDHSPLAFDVCTEEEAAALDDRETQAVMVRRPSADPTVVGTRSQPEAPLLQAPDTASSPRGRRG